MHPLESGNRPAICFPLDCNCRQQDLPFVVVEAIDEQGRGFHSRHGDAEVVSAGDGQNFQQSAEDAQFVLGSCIHFAPHR
jgi:hypothetical protein